MPGNCAGHDLTFNISGNVTNSATGLAYAGNDARLFIGGVLTNDQGAILAGHDLEIAGTASGLRNSTVTNISGLIQAGNDMSILTGNLTNERTAAPQWTTGVLVSSGVVTGFTLNPVAAGLPFGYLETADQNMYQLYAGVDPALWQDYQPLLWSKATLADGTTYRAWTWISADGPEKVGPIIDWIRARVPRDANGNPVVDPNNPSRYFIVDEVNFSGSDESTTYTWDWSSHLSQSVYEDRLVGTLSPEATIRAGGDLSIDATSLSNAYSSIEAAGDATLKGSTLDNTGVSLFRTTTTTCHAQAPAPPIMPTAPPIPRRTSPTARRSSARSRRSAAYRPTSRPAARSPSISAASATRRRPDRWPAAPVWRQQAIPATRSRLSQA